MTAKEFYEHAVKTGHDNVPITVNYQCGDDWYNYEEKIKKANIQLLGDRIEIRVIN